MPSLAFPEITLRSRVSLPPMVMLSAALNRIRPVPLPRAVPTELSPITFPATVLAEPMNVMPLLVLPAIRFPAPVPGVAVGPPTVMLP